MSLLLEEESFAIRGAIIEVHREMGSGFLEAVYQECLQREFAERKIPFAYEQAITLSYKGSPLDQKYRLDLVCYDEIILELKSVNTLSPKHRAQMLNYLKATQKKVGFLINFGAYPKAQIERFAL